MGGVRTGRGGGSRGKFGAECETVGPRPTSGRRATWKRSSGPFQPGGRRRPRGARMCALPVGEGGRGPGRGPGREFKLNGILAQKGRFAQNNFSCFGLDHKGKSISGAGYAKV